MERRCSFWLRNPRWRPETWGCLVTAVRDQVAELLRTREARAAAPPVRKPPERQETPLLDFTDEEFRLAMREGVTSMAEFEVWRRARENFEPKGKAQAAHA